MVPVGLSLSNRYYIPTGYVIPLTTLISDYVIMSHLYIVKLLISPIYNVLPSGLTRSSVIKKTNKRTAFQGTKRFFAYFFLGDFLHWINTEGKTLLKFTFWLKVGGAVQLLFRLLVLITDFVYSSFSRPLIIIKNTRVATSRQTQSSGRKHRMGGYKKIQRPKKKISKKAQKPFQGPL